MTELRLEGRLEESNLAKLMYSICRTGETGTLYLMRGSVTASIHINKGKVVFAASNDPDYRLGELLIKHGQITYSQYMKAASLLQPGKRLGAVLVEQGYLSAADLYHYVIEQVKEIIFNLFTWTEGTFRFEIGSLPSKEVITLNISTADLVVEGIKQITSWSRIAEAVGTLDTLYDLDPEFEKRMEGLTLTEGERRLLDLVRECRTLERILENTKFPDFDATRLLWAFSIIGLINQRGAMEAEVGDLLGEALGEEAPKAGPVPGAKPLPPPPTAVAPKPITVTVSPATAPPKPPKATVSPPAPPKAAAPPPPPPPPPPVPAVPDEDEDFKVEIMETSSSGGVSLDLDEEEEMAAEPKPPAAAPAAPGMDAAAVEAAVGRFNQKHGYFFNLLHAELEDRAEAFVREAMDKMERRHFRVFDGAKMSAEGAFETGVLVKNIRVNGLAQFQESLNALLEAELEAARAVFKNPARMMVIKKGLKRFDGKGET